SLGHMDIFALPDVFLRLLMRKMEVKDRLQLRLTCHAFERIVAGTHAGHFKRASVERIQRKSALQICIGDTVFTDIYLTKQGLERFINLRRRLFNGISIRSFEINV
ncbi:hypothetical protein PENTCL1PPCAC_21558, partial [Pristionchus entomophagus]